MGRYQHVTEEEVRKSLPFRIAKKELQKQYPWVMDIRFDTEDINKYSIIFLDIVMNGDQFQEEEDLKISPLVKLILNRNKEFMNPFLKIMVDGDDKDVASGIQHNMDDTVRAISKSEAIPKELALPRNRIFSISSFIIPQDTLTQ